MNGGRAWKGSPAEGARVEEAPGGGNDRCATGGGSTGNGGGHCGATSYGRIIEYPALGGTRKDRRENASVVQAFAFNIYIYIYNCYRDYCGGGFGGGSGELYAMCRPSLGRRQALSLLIPLLAPPTPEVSEPSSPAQPLGCHFSSLPEARGWDGRELTGIALSSRLFFLPARGLGHCHASIISQAGTRGPHRGAVPSQLPTPSSLRAGTLAPLWGPSIPSPISSPAVVAAVLVLLCFHLC